jgi:ferredoxin-nitrite reductase
MSIDAGFTEEQQQYLQGFVSGASAARAALGMPGLLPVAGGITAEPPRPSGPDAPMLAAQDRFLAAGRKLSAEEQAKRDKPPLDMWDEIVANAAAGRYPKGTDVFLYKFHGLYHTAPAQDGFMSRLKLPNGILQSGQLAGLADLAERFGGGYAHVTTRANIQIREIEAADAVRYLEGLFELGITSKGSGADNIRNITGSPTAGIDPQELIDTRPLAREVQHYIFNNRAFFGLPRKFNIAYDGGGRVAVLEETNDIGFTACEIAEGAPVPPGVYFRLALGGITGHRDLAVDEGVILRPEECTPVAAALLRVFLDEGDRTDRKKARLKYVLDRMGHAGFMAAVEERLGYRLPRLPLDACRPRGPIDRLGHLGIHPQKQEDRFYLGVALPVGRLTPAQMRLLADLARTYGDGAIRLTVWQNLLLSGLRGTDLDLVKARIEEAGLDGRPGSIRAGLVACTGAFGCKFGLAHTKETAEAIAARVDAELALDEPVNIHLTGCPNSCAQHYIGDIGLLGTKLERGDDSVEGFRLFVGGGWGNEARIARDLGVAVPCPEAPATITRMLKAWLDRREAGESFAAFTNRHDLDTLQRAFGLAATGDAAS